MTTLTAQNEPSSKPILFAKNRLFLWFATLVALISVASPSFGQGTTAALAGTVTDPAGATLAGARITVLNVATNLARTATTQTSGNFVLTELPPGRYSLTVDDQGFKPYQQNDIVLEISQRAEINVRLEVGSEEQKVTVTANAAALQTDDSSVGLVVDSDTIVNTPLNGGL